PRLSALNEDKEYLATTIDKYCQKDLSYYQIQTEIDLMTKVRYLLQERNYRLRTDGRRIMAYYFRISDKDEESIRLLKKMVEMDIEDFPPHILQQIKTHGKIVIKIYLQFITMVDINEEVTKKKENPNAIIKDGNVD
ncbi:hypothetical protein Godav_006527, partial [Gossypium davidsonii]|nr:hypothetical protein [Gossypium davidsonii]